MKLWTRPSPTHFLSRVDTLTRDIAAQPRQVGGSDRRNVISAETSATSHPICDIAGVNLPVSEQMKVLGVILDRRLTFEKHATAVAKSCNYHAQAIRHIRHLLTPELAQTLACSLILSRVDYIL